MDYKEFASQLTSELPGFACQLEELAGDFAVLPKIAESMYRVCKDMPSGLDPTFEPVEQYGVTPLMSR